MKPNHESLNTTTRRLAGLIGILALLILPPIASNGFGADLGQRRPSVQALANGALAPEKPAIPDRAKRQPDRGASRNDPAQRPSPSPGPTANPPSESSEHAGTRSLVELVPKESRGTLQNIALFAMASLAPAALLMFTAFVRINIVLMLLRQALGSPQIPGNQVLTALALMLTFLVMEPIGEKVYREAIVPYSAENIGLEEAFTRGMRPIKSFMAGQIKRYQHDDYVIALYDEIEPPRSGRVEPEYIEDFPFRVLAPAFLLSELTTALMWGFFLYLPFLVIDLVVSSVLAAMGLFMLPPTSIAMPIKLILFVLANGWLLVSQSLLASFATGGSSP